MSLDQEVEILRQIPLFANIDTAKLKLMCFASQRLTFKPGEALCRQGDAGDSAFVIVEGAHLLSLGGLRHGEPGHQESEQEEGYLFHE